MSHEVGQPVRWGSQQLGSEMCVCAVAVVVVEGGCKRIEDVHQDVTCVCVCVGGEDQGEACLSLRSLSLPCRVGR